MNKEQIIGLIENYRGDEKMLKELPRILKAILGDINEEIVAAIVDDLSSTDPKKALSAKQGKVLKELLDEKMSNPEVAGTAGQILQLDENGDPEWVEAAGVGATYDSAMSDSSTNAIQNKTVKKYVDDNFARQDGSYSALRVGTAENLVGRGSVPASFLFRTSGGSADIGTGNAKITKLYGKTLVWNQLVDAANNVSINIGVEYNGITVDYDNATGKYRVHGTATANYDRSIVEYQNTAGHSYLLDAQGLPTGSAGNVKCYANTGAGNELYNGDIKQSIITAALSRIYVFIASGQTVDFYFNINIFDLTLMNFAGVTTAAEFKSLFPLDYYAYNAGGVLPFAAGNLVTTGLNQWDEEWELGAISGATGQNVNSSTYIRSKNYIPIFPSTTYYVRSATTLECRMRFYDADKNYLGESTIIETDSNQTFTTPAGAYYMRFYMVDEYGTTYNHDICINLSWSGYHNGEYEPSEKHTVVVDAAGWLDTDGNLIFPYGGMHGTGSAADWAKPDADGYFHKGTRVFGRVNLGDLTYLYNAEGFFEARATPITGAKAVTNNTDIANIICSKYPTLAAADIYYGTSGNGIGFENTATPSVCIRDANAGTDAATFKTAMDGVYLYFELATPVEKELATPVAATYYVNDFGTEAWEPANDDEPYTTPCKVEIAYAMNAVDTIRNLPKNYISKDSFDNFCAELADKLGTAIDKTISIEATYDSETQEYDYSISITDNES